MSGFIFRADNYIVKSYKLRKDSSTKKYRKFMFIVGLAPPDEGEVSREEFTFKDLGVGKR